MAQIIQKYKDEVGFMKYYEENLLNKTTATFDKIKTAADMLGVFYNISCPSCSKQTWQELLSIYNQLEANRRTLKDNESKDIQKEVDPLKTDEIDVYTKLEYEEIKKTKSKK